MNTYVIFLAVGLTLCSLENQVSGFSSSCKSFDKTLSFISHSGPKWSGIGGYRAFHLGSARKGKRRSARRRSKNSAQKRKSTLRRPNQTKKSQRHSDRDTKQENTTPKRNKLLEEFGIDLGSIGQDIYDWLWPKENPVSRKKTRARQEYLKKGGYLPRTKPVVTDIPCDSVQCSNVGDCNQYLYRYLLHNYAQETIADIYRRIAFHMRLSPRILAREVAALLGKFGINMLQPEDEDYGKSIQPDILCLRRVKAKIYALLGRKLLKYHLLFLLRYIRLGIPPEIRDRYISDILTRANISQACDKLCSDDTASQPILPKDRKFSVKQDEPLNLTYPERVDFDDQGYPYSMEPFSQVDIGSSPSGLVHPQVFERLNERSKCKLVYIYAALHPQSTLQIIKNIATCAGYKCERDLLLGFCLGSKFGSRGAKSFVARLKEERISDKYLSKAAQLATGGQDNISVLDALTILRDVPSVSGLMKRHIDSGRPVMPIRTARMIFKRIRNNIDLQPRDMVLWDVMRQAIATKVPNAPMRLYKQVRMEVFAADTYMSPYLSICLKNRGIDASGIKELSSTQGESAREMDYDTRRHTAKLIRQQIRRLWIDLAHSSKSEMERIGLDIIDAMATAAGYGGLNNIIVLVKMLSKLPDDKNERRCRQPGPDFEHSPKLEIKDFKYKNLQDYGDTPTV